MMEANIVQQGAKFCGWFDAPFPIGKTDFHLDITSVDDNGYFIGLGSDKQGNFHVKGSLVGTEVNFVKNYEDGSHTGIQYSGKIEGNIVLGEYTYCFRKYFLKMDVCEKFWMERVMKWHLLLNNLPM